MKKGQVKFLAAIVIVFAVVLITIIWVIPALKNTSGSIFDTGTDLVNDATSKLDTTWVYHEGDTPVYTENIEEVVPVAPATGKCSDLPPKYWSGFSKYKDQVDKAVEASSLKAALSGTGYIPEALVASILSYESQWYEKAVGPCGDGGIAQFQSATASDMGLKWDYVGTYGRVYCSDFGVNCLGCSKCNPDYKSVCDLNNDPRFDASKAIPAAAKYIGARIADCRNKVSADKFVAIGVSSYNTGNCKKVNTQYIKRVLQELYPQFAACLSEMGYKPA